MYALGGKERSFFDKERETGDIKYTSERYAEKRDYTQGSSSVSQYSLEDLFSRKVETP
jgi:hypothetical protein